MITFIDGPAKGVTLELARTPILLRVVRDRNRVWDALDQVDDTPKASEQIFVYLLSGRPQSYHVRRANQCSGGRHHARYQFLEPQPADDQVRTTSAWLAWCETVREAMMMAWEASCHAGRKVD